VQHVSQPTYPSAHWHQRTDLLERWLHDFIVGHMRRLRPTFEAPHTIAGSSGTPNSSFHGLLLNRDQADIDSIELAELAGALYQALDAESSGALNQHSVGRSFSSWLTFCAHAAACTPVLSFLTSGSTGAARAIEHRCADLSREISDFLPVMRLPWQTDQQETSLHGFTPKRIVTVMPTQHVYGFLFGLVLPAQLGVTLLSLATQVPAEVRSHLVEGDVLIAHPNFWQAALNTRAAWPAALLGISSGQASPEPLFAAAASAGFRLLDIYGSTETAGIAWRDQAGPLTLMARYALAADGSLRDTYNGGAIVQAPDVLMHANGQITVQRRHDRVVQIAGVNVQLAHVESVIEKYADRVASVRICAQTGRLSAFLVGAEIADSILRALLKPHLRDVELPSRWHFGPELPRTEGGKLRAFE
jgi:long-chain acyl-CoA synthetase